MSKIDWTEMLGWESEEMEDLRFVAYSYIKQGHYDIALKFFEGLVILDPNNSYDLQTIGALYLQKGNSLEALHYLDRALKLVPDHFPSLLNRAKSLFMLGYKNQGITQAMELEKCEDPNISKQASALLLAYI